MRYEFVVNVFTFNSDYTALLFVERSKPPFVGQFLPPGGHVEAEETPIQAARREVMEETGLEVDIVDFRPSLPIVLDSSTVRLQNPVHVQVEYIDKDHKHVDFIFAAELLNGDDSICKAFRDKGVRWLTLNDIKSAKMPRNVKDMAGYLFRFKQEE